MLFSEDVYLVVPDCCCHCGLLSSALPGFKECFHLDILTAVVKRLNRVTSSQLLTAGNLSIKK